MKEMVEQLRRVIRRIAISNYYRNSSIANYSEELADQDAMNAFYCKGATQELPIGLSDRIRSSLLLAQVGDHSDAGTRQGECQN